MCIYSIPIENDLLDLIIASLTITNLTIANLTITSLTIAKGVSFNLQRDAAYVASNNFKDI